MIVYTVKNEEGNLCPLVKITFPNITEAVIDGKIVTVDNGLEEVEAFCVKYNKKGKDSLLVVKCEIKEIE